MSASALHDTIQVSIIQKVEAAIDNLQKAVGESYLCETSSCIDRQVFLDTILERLSRSLEENISEVKFRRNTSTSINRLPTEILSQIFSLYAAEMARPPCKPLLLLSRVCQRWRYTIVNNATFWTSIDFIGAAELVKIALHRSKEADLQIEINDLLFLCPAKLALVRSILTSQTHRIEKISATLRASNVNVIGDALFQPFPSLRYLMIRGDYYNQAPDLRIPFAVNTNSLEALDVFSCRSIPWSSLQPLLNRAKKVKIRFEDQDSYLNFFAHIQTFNLKVLSIHCCFVSDLPRLTTPITVRGLTGLIIQNSALIALVDTLHTPDLRRLTICDEINHTFRSDLQFDYSSIRYISVGAFPSSGFFRFYVVGSTEKDDIPSDYLWDQEFHVPYSSSVKRFQIRMHFNQAFTGFLNVLKTLNDVLSKTTAVQQVCIPSFLPNPRCLRTDNRVPLSTITHWTPNISPFSLASTTSYAYIFKS